MIHRLKPLPFPTLIKTIHNFASIFSIMKNGILSFTSLGLIIYRYFFTCVFAMRFKVIITQINDVDGNGSENDDDNNESDVDDNNINGRENKKIVTIPNISILIYQSRHLDASSPGYNFKVTGIASFQILNSYLLILSSSSPQL